MSAFPSACNSAHARAIGERMRAQMQKKPQTDEDKATSAKKDAQTTTNFGMTTNAHEKSPPFPLLRRSFCQPNERPSASFDGPPSLSVSWPPPAAGVGVRKVFADALRGFFPGSASAAAADIVSSTAAN